MTAQRLGNILYWMVGPIVGAFVFLGGQDAWRITTFGWVLVGLLLADFIAAFFVQRAMPKEN